MTLLDIEDYLRSLTVSFAALLDLEFTILGGNPLKRITGTGFYATIDSKIQRLEWNPRYTRQVMRSGEPLEVLDTSEFTATMTAERKKIYDEHYSLLLHPIKHNGETVGTIVIASFNENQQQQLLKKRRRLMEYLACVTELIELKLMQDEQEEQLEILNRQLELIYEAIETGVLLWSDGVIARMNERTKSYLCAEISPLYDSLIDDIDALARAADSDGKKRNQELYCSEKGRSVFVTVQAIPLGGETHNVICTITPFAQTQNIITQHDNEVDNGELVASSESMIQIVNNVKTVACHDSNILILGESGTGKEMLARMIHQHSNRKNQPFVAVNCAAIPESLLESELFGYEGGAFTGAHKNGKLGKFMLADGGTLFLDEIGDMPLYLQAKLLRVISERKVDRIGGATPIEVDVRIVSATNQNLEKMVEGRSFRGDLYYRLNVIPIRIPPLRDRKDDIVPLAKHFLTKYNEKLGRSIEGIRGDVLDKFLQYDWPGNVRELENCIEYMVNFESTTYLSREFLPTSLKNQRKSSSLGVLRQVNFNGSGSLKDRLRQYEQEIFSNFLSQHEGKPSLEDIDAFCEALQISRATYYRKCVNSQN